MKALLLISGATLAFGADWTVAPLDPILGLDAAVLLPADRTDPQTGQPGTPALPVPYPRTGQGGDPALHLPDAITGNPGDPRYPYREPLPAPPPGGPPPGPPAAGVAP